MSEELGGQMPVTLNITEGIIESIEIVAPIVQRDF